VTNQSKPYGPLTADNSALILVDHQIGMAWAKLVGQLAKAYGK